MVLQVFMYIYATNGQIIVFMYLPETFKILIGVELVWLMIELIVQIKRVIRLPMAIEGTDLGHRHPQLYQSTFHT